MAQRFKGEFVQKMDGKGRVSIPAAFRRVLEDCDPEHNPDREPQLVLVYGDHRRAFIEGFTMTAMEEVDDKIAQLPRGSKPRRALERTFSGQAVQLQVNETGQIVLSPKLREKLGLTNQVFFIASGDTFQIWHPDTYEDQASAMDDYLDEFEEGFDVLSLLDATPEV